MSDDSQFLEAELARLADGSLPESREAELRDAVRHSPDLARALADQEHAFNLVRSADVAAPDSLRQWLDQQTDVAQPRQSDRGRLRWRPRIAIPALAIGLAAATAAVAVAVSGSSAPTLGQATQAALAPATLPPPSETSSGAMTIDVSAGGIRFPYWTRTIGWRTTGARTDSLTGRHAVTVFYGGRAGHRVGYTIVTGAPLPVHGGTTVTRDGIPFTFIRDGSANAVTWVRSGHTCVIAGRQIDNQTLLKLATADIPT
jgi:hypothetical protein